MCNRVIKMSDPHKQAFIIKSTTKDGYQEIPTYDKESQRTRCDLVRGTVAK